MADFTDEEIKKATQRVMEMRNRSIYKTEKETTGRKGVPNLPDFVKLSADSGEPPTHIKENKPNIKGGVGKLLNMINFKGIGIDGDTNLLLGILLLLGGDSTDELLTLALIYIML